LQAVFQGVIDLQKSALEMGSNCGRIQSTAKEDFGQVPAQIANDPFDAGIFSGSIGVRSIDDDVWSFHALGFYPKG
jgi:hypothetical protein